MQTLYDGSSGIQIGRTTQTGEVQGLLKVLMRIATELAWQPGEQLDAYREVAQHLVVTVEGRVAGGLQVIHGASVPMLPLQFVWPEVAMPNKAITAHITILALLKEYRGLPNLFGFLCVELWRFCVREGIEQIVIEATPPTLRLYRRLGWPLEIIGDLRPHWEEECYLCRMGVQQVAEALTQKACRSISYRALVEQAYRDLPGKPPLTRATSF